MNQSSVGIETKNARWTMRLTHLRIYSAPTMAAAYALIDRLIVEITVAPLGTVKADRDWQNSKGLATCSITCKEIKVIHIFDPVH